MALEDLTGTKYIDALTSTNPTSTDNRVDGDDHIRGIKNVLKTTFPNISGAVSATHTELNYVDVTTLGTSQASKAVTVSAGAAIDNSAVTWTNLGAVTTVDINGGTLDGVTITSPKIITALADTNGNELLKVTATGSAVNELTLANAATGGNPTLSATGGDTNIGIAITAKGTGGIDLNPGSDGVTIGTGNGIDGVLDEDTMSSDSATHLATQQSIKAYVDTEVAAATAVFASQVTATSGATAELVTSVPSTANVIVIAIESGAGANTGTRLRGMITLLHMGSDLWMSSGNLVDYASGGGYGGPFGSGGTVDMSGDGTLTAVRIHVDGYLQLGYGGTPTYKTTGYTSHYNDQLGSTSGLSFGPSLTTAWSDLVARVHYY